MSDKSTGRSPATVIRVVVTVLLGGIGAAAGFKHTHDWAVSHGQVGWLAWADAVVIEGMAVVAGFEIHRDRQRRNRPRRRVSFPVVVLVVAFGVQMTAQVALAEPTPAGWLLAAMPALGFLVVVKLLMRRMPEPTTATSLASSPAVSAAAASVVGPVESSSGSVESSPANVSAAGSGDRSVPRVRLPADVLERVGTVVQQARDEGRHPTAADVRAVVRVPEEMADRILSEFDQPDRNGHPVLS